jgi:multisubunit Na+/H+ antiporter MnhB subunit
MGAATERAADETAREHGGGPTYGKFLAMIATSTVVMFLLTYTNSMRWAHVRWSEERFYMALLMGGAMAIVMLAFMWGMYPSRRKNLAIVIGALALSLGALWLSRSQTFVDDQAYMRGMIPHHSIAILTSERSDIDDIRVRELANGIIEAQRREIGEMEWLIADIAENGPATTREEADARPVPEFTGEVNPPGDPGEEQEITSDGK